MLNHCIAEYAPCPYDAMVLAPQEVLHYSFLVSLTTKTRLGYQAQPQMDFYCHLTNQRLLLEPLEFTTDAQIQALSLAHIKAITVVRSLAFNSFAQLQFHPSGGSQPEDLVLRVRALPDQRSGNDSNRAEDFVLLTQQLLGNGPGEDLSNPLVQELQVALASDRLVLIDFWLPGCRPCFVLGKVLERLLQQYGDQVTMIKIDVEENQALAMQYGVDCFPTVLVAQSGVVIDQLVGALPKSVVAEILEQYIQPVAVA